MSDPTMSGQPDQSQMGAIEVKTSFFVLAILLYLVPAKATINGSGELNQGWGTQVYPIPAGRHQLRVWCPYFGFKMGDLTRPIDVYPGQATVVEWKAPWIVFFPGTWVDLGMRPIDMSAGALAAGTGPVQPVATTGPAEQAAPASAAVPAGWHPDPQGVAALRYWDGQQWTEHTSDGQPTAS